MTKDLHTLCGGWEGPRLELPSMFPALAVSAVTSGREGMEHRRRLVFLKNPHLQVLKVVV